MKYLLSRLAETSTWLGLFGLIPTIMVATQGPITPQIIGGIVSAGAAVLMKEQGGNA